MGTLWQNMRYAIRALGRSPGFTAVAVLSLALGIGANTAIFSLIDALLLRSIPVQHPEQLVELYASRQDAKTMPFSFPMFRELDRGQRVFSGLIGWSYAITHNIDVNGTSSQEPVGVVMGNYYSELGVSPLLGRLIAPDDANPSHGSSQVAVLSYQFWQERLGGDLGVLGKGIQIEGVPFTVIGVTRKWFTGLTPGLPPPIVIPITDMPLISSDNLNMLESRSLLWIFVTGRLKPGVTIEQARAQLQSFWPGVLAATAPTQVPGLRLHTWLTMGLVVAPASTGITIDLRSKFTRPLYVLLGIVGMILLVACVNLANLMLARAASRGHESSVRLALGASRWTLARQVLTESLLLSLAGAVLGIALAYWGSRFLVTLISQTYIASPLSFDLRPDGRVLALTAGIAILTGILFGLAPAWRVSREHPAAILQESGRGYGRGAGRLRQVLIVIQVALSLILLVGAGLLARTFRNLSSIDLGFQRDNLLELILDAEPGGYKNLDFGAYYAQLINHISSLPGVRSVGFAGSPVPSPFPQGWRSTVAPISADPSIAGSLMANLEFISPGFFQTLRIGLIRGRDFDWTDDQHHPAVAIVSKSLAQRLFPDGRVIGQRIRFGILPTQQNLEIVGVASDARLFDLRDASAPIVYVPSAQQIQSAGWGSLFVRTSGPPGALASELARTVDSFGHEYVFPTRTVAEVTGQMLVPERVTAMLSSVFAGLALLLASVGLYGLMSYAVARRTREMGIRVAVGARPRDVLWIVLRESSALVLGGIAIGVPCALACSRLISGMLFGLSPSDLLTLAGASLLLLVVALCAGYLPARRASRIDPVAALRCE